MILEGNLKLIFLDLLKFQKYFLGNITFKTCIRTQCHVLCFFSSKNTAPQDLPELLKKPKYTSDELMQWYKIFKEKHPHGCVTEEEFIETYQSCFPSGKILLKHVDHASQEVRIY